MEHNGYRLDSVYGSYCFSFKESEPKEMNYFISYKSFRGPSMGNCDYALLSKYKANRIKSSFSFFNTYRTKEQKEKMKMLYEVRMDYIKYILFEKVLTSFFSTILFVIIFLAGRTQSGILWILTFAILSACFTAYYLFGYIKQIIKCKKYERDNL
jgi:hypothetical protein